MTDHDKMLIEELERRLLWYREEASADEFDADEVDAICTMLLKLSPENRPRRSKEEAYQNILRQICLEEDFAGEEERGEGDPAGNEAEEECAVWEKCAGAEETEEDSAVEECAVAGKEEYAGGEECVRADKEKADGIVVFMDEEREESVGNGSGKKRRFFIGKRGIRAAVIFLVAASALLSLNMVSYARENKSLFTMILERVGVLKIVKDETVAVSETGSIKAEGEFYDSWVELAPEIKKKIIVPGYIPKGYSLYGVRRWDFSNRKTIQANYYNQENGHILFEITLWESNADQYRENLIDESIYMLIPEYSDKNTLYYAYEDEYICLAFMENSFYRISGNIALEEVVKIREGM